MRVLRITVVAMMILAWVSLPVYADSIEELKTMILQLKDDYESKIQALQAKVDQLEANQELKVSDKVDEIRDQIKEEVKAETLNVEYVGRRQGPVGSGGLLVRNPFGFGDVTLGGYFDTEYRDLAKTDSTFQQHRWIINIGAAMHDKLRFNSELEIEYGGPNTPSSDGEIKVEQAYGDYLINEMVNLRAGALLVPFGRYNLYHDSDLQDLSDRPILARDIIPTTWTEAGYGFFGDMNPSIGSYEDLLLKYEVYVVNGLDTGFSDTGMGGAKNSLKIDNNEGKSIVGRVSVEPISGHEVAFSGYWGDYNKTDDSISGIGMDWLSNWGPLEFVGEYAYFGVEESPTLSSDLANFFQGAYTQFNYHFWPEFLNNTFLGSNFKDPTLTAVTRYDWALISDDSDAGNTNNREDRWTLGLNYRPIDNVVFKFEYQWNRTKSEVLEAGNNDGFITSVAMGF